MFIDRAKIQIRAGKGGDGKVSFKRSRLQPKGGPDGGDGGDGGSIIFEADLGLNTLVDFAGVHLWKAEPGQDGQASNKHGKNGQDRVIRVPPGTIVIDEATDEPIADVGPKDRVVLARGGRGGFGNDRFKNSINQAPRHAEPGEPGEKFDVRLELKLIADAGFVGLPNAGKSTLLGALTRASAKTGAYPFTTITPQLGVLEIDPKRTVVLADLPGLIEGAADGAGLGHQFLQHVERTRAIVHLVDPMPASGTPAENYLTIREELTSYSEALAAKPELVVLTKADVLDADDPEQPAETIVHEFRRALRPQFDPEIVVISAATNQGLDVFKEKLWQLVNSAGLKAGGWNA